MIHVLRYMSRHVLRHVFRHVFRLVHLAVIGGKQRLLERVECAAARCATTGPGLRRAMRRRSMGRARLRSGNI